MLAGATRQRLEQCTSEADVRWGDPAPSPGGGVGREVVEMEPVRALLDMLEELGYRWEGMVC